MSELEYADAPRKACIHCGMPILTVASVCFACKKPQAQSPAQSPPFSGARIVLNAPESGSFHLLPAELELASGSVPVHDMDGHAYWTSDAFLAPFVCDGDTAESHLDGELSAALKQAGNAFRRLTTCQALIAGKNPTVSGDDGGASFSRLLGILIGEREPLPPDLLRAIEAFASATPDAHGRPADLASLFSSDEQAGMVGTVMSRLRDIAGRLDASVLAERDDPAAWVEVLHRELFAEQTAKADRQRQDRIRGRVNQSIVEGLRRQGLTPAGDAKRKDAE